MEVALSEPSAPTTRSRGPGYELFMLVLCLYALIAIAVQGIVKLDPEVSSVLNYADDGICVLFFFDFLYSLWAAPSRWIYFRTWGWIDLLSCIPMLDSARWGRVARISRIFRVLRGFRATKLLTSAILKHRAENTFLAAATLALMLIIICSIAVLQFEAVPEANIKTAEDAVWWAVTTVTTVGYGDRFPVTSEGRVVAGLLMFSGVGLFSIFSGFLAAWFLKSGDDSSQNDLTKLRNEIRELREFLEAKQ